MPQLTRRQTKRIDVPNDPNKGWVEIAYLKKGVRKRIQDDSNKITGSDDGTGVMVTTMAFDLGRQRKLFLEAVIVSWGGFLDSKDKETRPTPNNIRKFVDEDDKLYEWLQEESDAYVIEVEGEEEPAQENS